MSRQDNIDPWNKDGFKRKAPAKKNPVEIVTLPDGIKEVLLFLKAPEAGLASVASFKNETLKAQIREIQTEHLSVYNTESGSEGDTPQRRNLKEALDDISAAAKALLNDYNTKPISKGALRRTHVIALQAGLKKVAACKEAFDKSGAHDGLEASGYIWKKMFDGSSLDGFVVVQAKGLAEYLQDLATDKSPKLG